MWILMVVWLFMHEILLCGVDLHLPPLTVVFDVLSNVSSLLG